MKHDLISDVFCIIKNAESIGKNECITPASSLIRNVLKIMHQHKYIGNFNFIDDKKGGKFKIQLLGKINECNAIRPRFSVKLNELAKFEKRHLPAINVGILILSTPAGILDQDQTKKQKTGGKLIGFVY